jgi:hypothetical protein
MLYHCVSLISSVLIVKGFYLVFTYNKIEGVLFNYFLHKEFNAINRYYDQIEYLIICSYLFFYCFIYVLNKKIIISKIKNELLKENEIIIVDKEYEANYKSIEDKKSFDEEKGYIKGNGNNNFYIKIIYKKNLI